MVSGVGACIVGIVLDGRGRGWGWGGATVALFAAFTAFAALSILWSVEPDWSWFGANQLLSYLSAFAGAAAVARVFPERWVGVIDGITVAAVALAGYALLVKVFPHELASGDTLERLDVPFGYWNALGLIAAIGLPACLWSGSRLEGGRLRRTLSTAAMTVLITGLILSYSRSALMAGVIGTGFYLVFAQARLRALAVLVAGGIGAALVVLWALGHVGVGSNGLATSGQDSAGRSFGLVLLVVLGLVVGAGWATSVAMDRVTLNSAIRRKLERGLLLAPVLVLIGAVVALAASSRGVTGEIAHAWNTLTSADARQPGNDAARLSQFGSSRPMYWAQALSVGEHALLKGVGELGYGIARLRYTTLQWKADQAHSYLMQTFADLGLIGIALTLALLVFWDPGWPGRTRR